MLPLKACCHIKLHFWTVPHHLLLDKGSLVKEVAQNAAMLLLCPNHLVLIFVLYMEVYVIDKKQCEYEPYQTMDYAVNP